ncbi:hypothetical protein GCM10011348_04550 [Marinobacterium nitratireducens]|uniref:Uncharacterized protein n=1 Tax=Marinobacterium nitratireducens TaxID=518897 RepID=A0A917Z6Q1_9GAMM|nr:hypothetical protein [Marinobacterium nitratireducens]GGO76706.1 hypothetical protein GCM10011348_04550 [Marinobacterium nitratireducens]
MSNEASNPGLEALIERIDLSALPQTEIIRLKAEAARAEYISSAIVTLTARIKAAFTGRKSAAAGLSGLHHA